jgi:hypothetical protein
MKVLTTLILITVTGMLLGCGSNSSGSDASEPSQKEIQLSGTVPRSLSTGSTFSDTLEFVNGKIGNVDLGDNKPEWVKVKTNKNDKQVIIYGTTPDKASSHKLSLNIQGDPSTSENSAFGLSFRLSVTEIN